MIKAILFSALIGISLGEPVYPVDFDVYDISDVYDQFQVSCGTPEEPYMSVTFSGDAFSVYAAEAPDACKAKEVAPTVFQLIIDDYANHSCPVKSVPTGEIVMCVPSRNDPVRLLDVVVQKGTVRKSTDEYKQITCNYGLGGKVTNEAMDAVQGVVDKQPVWKDAANKTETTTDIVTLSVYDVSNQEVDEVVLGDYIQLTAVVTPQMQNVSVLTYTMIRIFDCKASADDLEYFFVIGGCGEGDVMPADRGFRTKMEVPVCELCPEFQSVSQSSYFKSFLLPDKTHLTFECSYILYPCNWWECEPTYSCDNSVMHRIDENSRSKRAVDSYSPISPPASQRHRAISTRVKILPQEQNHYRIASNDLIHAEKTKNPHDLPAKTAHVPEFTKYAPEPTFVRESAPSPAAGLELLMGLDLMTIGLIFGIFVLGLLLIVATTCLFLYRKQGAVRTSYKA